MNVWNENVPYAGEFVPYITEFPVLLFFPVAAIITVRPMKVRVTQNGSIRSG